MSLLDNPAYVADLNSELSNVAVGNKYGISEMSVRRHKGKLDIAPAVKPAKPAESGEGTEASSDGSRAITAIRSRPVTLDDARDWIETSGDDPDNYVLSIRSIAYGVDMFSNRMSATPKHKTAGNGPAWPVIQPAAPVFIEPAQAITVEPRDDGMKLALKCADHQIGFRALADGSYDPFHDDRAMALFINVCRMYQPDKIQVLGDFLDLPSQSRWAQEASFARTTQMALDTAHRWLAELRAACPNSEIIVIEGNHDKRMQNFMETNALAAFGLRRADMPGSWPVMSLPNLLRLDDLNVRYIDAYPAATDWDNGATRNIHGTRVNSSGSTMSQYVHALPHINTWAGHTHRAEIIYHTGIGHYGEPVDSYAANPGCMCRIDGGAPSVKGAIGADGVPVKVVEDWQQGFGMLYYTETESWPQVYRIKNGRAIIGDRIISAE